jgi:hypothetical protein
MKQFKALVGIVLLSSGVCRAQYPTPLATDANTRFLYQFNETSGTTAFDTSGANRHATYGPDVILSQPTVFETGKSIISQEKILLNSATYWQAPAGSAKTSILSTDIFQNDFTVQMWVNWNGNAPLNQVRTLFAIQPISTTDVDVRFGILPTDNPFHPNGLTVLDGSGTNLAFDEGGTAWQVDTWYHVALVVDYLESFDTNYKIYWTPEGITTPSLVRDYTRPAGITLSSSTNDRQLIIGQEYGDSGKRFWPGEIDGFKFSNKALTSDELDDTLQLIPEPASALLLMSGLVAAWKLRRRG